MYIPHSCVWKTGHKCTAPHRAHACRCATIRFTFIPATLLLHNCKLQPPHPPILCFTGAPDLPDQRLFSKAGSSPILVAHEHPLAHPIKTTTTDAHLAPILTPYPLCLHLQTAVILNHDTFHTPWLIVPNTRTHTHCCAINTTKTTKITTFDEISQPQRIAVFVKPILHPSYDIPCLLPAPCLPDRW